MSETLCIERTFQAPAQAVFDAWTSEEVMRRWFHGEHDWETPEAHVDLRLGGSVRVVMRDPVKDTEYGGGGYYTEIDPPTRLVFTWTWDSEAEQETLIELDFEEADGATTVRLTHSRLRDQESVISHEGGWNNCLDKLGWALAAAESPSEREARARELVLRLYSDRRDSHGEPMVRHIEKVAELSPPEVKLLGWLHDVAEDGLEPLDQLGWEMGLSPEELEALRLLTREKSTPYAAYIEQIADADAPAGELARKVKIADLRANLSRPPHPQRTDLEPRYRAALQRLGD